jgi:hypothetical protein
MKKGPSALYRLTSLVLAFSFAAVGVVFLFWPGGTISLFNEFSARLGFEPAPESGFLFFPVLAVAYMYLVTALAWLMFINPSEKRYPLLLAQAKAASALVSFGFFFFRDRYLIYLANGIVDGGICLLAVALAAGLRSRLRAEASAKASG